MYFKLIYIMLNGIYKETINTYNISIQLLWKFNDKYNSILKDNTMLSPIRPLSRPYIIHVEIVKEESDIVLVKYNTIEDSDLYKFATLDEINMISGLNILSLFILLKNIKDKVYLSLEDEKDINKYKLIGFEQVKDELYVLNRNIINHISEIFKYKLEAIIKLIDFRYFDLVNKNIIPTSKSINSIKTPNGILEGKIIISRNTYILNWYLITNDDKINEKLKNNSIILISVGIVNGNIHIAQFYSKIAQDETINKLLKEETKLQLKGLPYSSLCVLLNLLLQYKYISINFDASLEASGEKYDQKDMMNLVNYYEHIGFKTLTNNIKIIKQQIENDQYVPMISNVSELINNCIKKSKHKIDITYFSIINKN